MSRMHPKIAVALPSEFAWDLSLKEGQETDHKTDEVLKFKVISMT